MLILLTLVLLGSVSCKKSSSNYPVDTFEGGKLFKSPSGSFYIAELNGTFHEMGRQYGLLLKQQLGDFYQEAVIDFMMGEKGAKYEDLVAYGKNNYNAYPQIFKDYLDGITETCGLNSDQTHIMSLVLSLIYMTGCSSLSAWGDYTPDHNVVVGRNWDLFSANLRRFSKFFHVVVWNPINYPASVANIDFIGNVYFQTSINNKGIFLDLQNGQASDTTIVLARESTNNILLESLFSNVSSDEVDHWFSTTLPQSGAIMNASLPVSLGLSGGCMCTLCLR